MIFCLLSQLKLFVRDRLNAQEHAVQMIAYISRRKSNDADALLLHPYISVMIVLMLLS